MILTLKRPSPFASRSKEIPCSVMCSPAFNLRIWARVRFRNVFAMALLPSKTLTSSKTEARKPLFHRVQYFGVSASVREAAHELVLDRTECEGQDRNRNSRDHRTHKSISRVSALHGRVAREIC